ncbi:hypothetical protein HID58_088357 [Brassica napus]|uniref:Uncharacterized protein n=1 Tax=Brassica napus TaxID=3708 RepID=A0ABQ7XYI5_BRANA|nr:hypothetical protein HID58_088357 [Brassica napus]
MALSPLASSPPLGLILR